MRVGEVTDAGPRSSLPRQQEGGKPRRIAHRPDGAHDATQDALAATRLAWRLARHYPVEVGEPSLAELHGRQVVWSQQWADSLNQYWRSQGQDRTMDGTWPVRRTEADRDRNTVPPVQLPATLNK